jgi:hypothetical protein
MIAETVEINTQETLANRTELVKPSVPLDYVDAMICSWGGDALHQWMMENCPDPAWRLFNGIILGYLVQVAAAKNGGMIDKDMDQDLFTRVPEIIRDMSALGWKW